MSYIRVIPRDLFNEAKLLKCLGQLSLIIHEGKGIRWPIRLEHDDSDDMGFRIEQDPNSGSIYCSNITLWADEDSIDLTSPLNSKSAYPLHFVTEENEDRVFNEDGTLSAEFIALLDTMAIDAEDAPDEESDDPDEDDITTSDGRVFFQSGRHWLTIDDIDANVGQVIRAKMEAERFYPNVWMISDHGNAIPFGLDD